MYKLKVVSGKIIGIHICHPFKHATGTRKDDYIHKYKKFLIFQKTKVLKILKKISFYFSEYKWDWKYSEKLPKNIHIYNSANAFRSESKYSNVDKKLILRRKKKVGNMLR